MADEELISEESEQIIQVEEDGEDETPATVEDYARARGWKPKEEWDGQGEHRSAREFLDFGLDRAKDVSRDLKELRRTTETMAETQARIMREREEEVRREERERLLAQHERAVEEGDTETARNIVSKISQAPQQVTPDATNKFIGENPWFNADPIARQVAIAAAGTVANADGSNVEEQLRHAKEVVLKRFPEYAPEAAREPAKVIDVATPSTTARAPKRGKTFADLPREAQEAARAMVAQGMLKNTDGYVRQYFNKEGTVE